MKLRPLVGLTAMLVGMTALAVPQPALAKTVSFAGYSWAVKSGADLLGPGPNLFSDSAQNAVSYTHLTLPTICSV